MPETGLVDVLTTKIVAWEAERGNEFTYDGVSFLIPVLFSWMFNSFQNQVQSYFSFLYFLFFLYCVNFMLSYIFVYMHVI
jgi:hypothetical protein